MGVPPLLIRVKGEILLILQNTANAACDELGICEVGVVEGDTATGSPWGGANCALATMETALKFDPNAMWASPTNYFTLAPRMSNPAI
jgi:hypothetical protein